VSVIELERHRKKNPPLPSWLADDYHSALQILFGVATIHLSETTDPLDIRSILGFIAFARGQHKLGALLSNIDESEIDEWLEDRMSWKELYAHSLP
jgi:hypothetical protein